jgi:hypothetical protein
VGRLARQALAKRCGMKKAVAAQESQSVQVWCGRSLKRGTVIQDLIRPVTDSIQKKEDNLHDKF